MHPSAWNVALQGLNFLVLVWLLQRFLFKPVRAVLAKRQEAIAAAVHEADARKAEADRDIELYRAKAAGVADEAARARAEAIAAAEGDVRRIRDDGVRQLQTEMDRARARLDRERVEALAALQAHAGKLAGVIAMRLLREVAPDSDALFLWRATASIDALDPSARASAAARFVMGPIETISSRPLDDSTRNRFEQWLAHLAGVSVKSTYRVDEELIAGVELRLPSGVWRANWRDSVDRIRTELTSHVAAA
jgi:F-type H+-transporting ATPase subunit b